MAANEGWLTPKNIVWGIIIFIGFAIFGAVFGPDKPSGSDQMKPDASDEDIANEISATDLVRLGNAAAIRTRFSSRFVVSGRVLKVEDEAGSFGKRRYMVSLVGTLNNRNLCDAWVECVMSNDGGLEKIGPGHFVKVEGVFDRAMGSVIYLKNCCLSKKYHSY